LNPEVGSVEIICGECPQRFWCTDFQIKNGTNNFTCTSSSPHLGVNQIKLHVLNAQQNYFIILTWNLFKIKNEILNPEVGSVEIIYGECPQRFWCTNFQIKKCTNSFTRTTSSPHLVVNQIKLHFLNAQQNYFIILTWNLYSKLKMKYWIQKWGVLR